MNYKFTLSVSIKIVLMTISSFLSIELYAQQFYVNKEWETQTAVLGSQHHQAATIPDGNGNVLSVANKRNNGTSDIHTSKKNPHGNLEWQDLLTNLQNGSTTQNYGTDIKRDSQGNVYICGAYFNGVDYDMLVVKYNNAGTELWRRQYNGTGNSDDAPASMALDNNGNVFVTGGSTGTNSLTDFLTLKINGTNGAILWNARYDFNQQHDGAIAVKLDNSGMVYVCGSSAQNNYDSDFTLIQYDPSNGNQIQVRRHATPQNGYDIPIGMEIDQTNTVYVLGSANYGMNSDLKLISYSSGLAVNWVSYFDGSGLEDEAGGISLDQAGDLVITGSTKNNQNETHLLTAKYDHTNGSLIWQQLHGSSTELTASKGVKIKTDGQGNLFVLGEVTLNGVSHVKVLSFDASGTKRWEHTNDNPSLSPQQALDLIVDGNDIFLTGIKEVNGDPSLFTVKLSQNKRGTTFQYDPGGNPIFASNELIIRFEKDALNLNTIDNLDIQFGKIETFLRPEAAELFLSTIKPKGGVNYDKSQIMVYRIFKRMKSTQTTATNRLGQTIEIPEFYATFVVQFPGVFDMPEVADQLTTIFPTVIYTDPNLIAIGHAGANDPLYETEQASLHPTAQYPNADINIEPAWDLEDGRSFVRVGVFDTGVKWEHEDFGNGTAAGSKIIKAWDFVEDEDDKLTTVSDGYGHGTPVASIIGGLRNNSTGAAGIAGGDGMEPGVSLYSARLLDLPSDDTTAWDYVFEAIVTTCLDEADFPSDYSYSLNVQNHSWGTREGFTAFYNDEFINSIIDAVHSVNRMQVTFVASRGNAGIQQDNGEASHNYPGVIDEDWVLCVGGTGTDGQYWDNINDCVTGTPVENCLKGSRGSELDVSAPASGYLTKAANILSSNNYTTFGGTSSAAPHVSGTVALMMSYHNVPGNDYNNLAPEDCEHILERTATDCNASNFPGYDTLTGHGRINAGLALQQLKPDDFHLIHIGTDNLFHNESITQVSSGNTIHLLEPFHNVIDDIWFAPGDYRVNTYKVEQQFFFPFNLIPAEDQILDAWARSSSSNLFAHFDNNNNLLARERIKFDMTTVSASNGYASGYAYEVSDTFGNFIGWFPFDPHAHPSIMEVTVLTEDALSNAQVKELTQGAAIALHPNPANEVQQLDIKLPGNAHLEVRLFDLGGQVVSTIFEGQTQQEQISFEVNTRNLSPGLYVYEIRINDKVYHKKMLIQK